MVMEAVGHDPRLTRPRPTEGDVFTVRLDALQCWTVGVVSRVSVRWPHLVLAHHFPFRWSQQPRLDQLPPMSAEDAVLVCRVSDLALCDGLWPIIGKLPSWSVEHWPMPRFVVPARRPGEPWREEIYYEADPGQLKRSVIVSDPAAVRRLPEGGAVGAGFAVERLIEVLKTRELPALDGEVVLRRLVA